MGICNTRECWASQLELKSTECWFHNEAGQQHQQLLCLPEVVQQLELEPELGLGQEPGRCWPLTTGNHEDI